MDVDDIFGYDKVVTAELASLQQEMNYRVRKELIRIPDVIERERHPRLLPGD
jgi:hypothetical protein